MVTSQVSTNLSFWLEVPFLHYWPSFLSDSRLGRAF